MKSSQVRDLARRYATGKLSQENYRNQRRLLVDSITGDQVQLSYREDERTAAHRPRSHHRLLSLTVVVLVAAGIGVVLLMRHNAHGQGGAQAATSATPAVAAPPPAPGPNLVKVFVEADDWTDVSMRSFERRWESLGADEQAKAKDSLMYPRLVSGVHQQIDSEKAVAGGATATDPHLMELQKLA
ncbi:MAG: hypothetical protein ACHQ7M_15065, partial [Chloroflexota bacterium]